MNRGQVKLDEQQAICDALEAERQRIARVQAEGRIVSIDGTLYDLERHALAAWPALIAEHRKRDMETVIEARKMLEGR